MALCDVAPVVTSNAGHVTHARMTLSPVASRGSAAAPPPSSSPSSAEKEKSELRIEDVENEEDEERLQKILGQLTDMSPETFDKRKAIRQRILDLKARARGQREKERQEREKRREEDIAKRRKEREQERKERFQRIQDLTKTRPDPASTSQEFLQKRRDSASKLREKEKEAIRKASFTRQKSIVEELREEEMKNRMETAKEDRERQMQCMQDIRRMSITGASWKSATPSLSPSSLMSFHRGPTTRESSATSSIDEVVETNEDDHDDDGIKDDAIRPPDVDHQREARLSKGGDDVDADLEPSPASPQNGSMRATLLLAPNSSSASSRGLKATLQAVGEISSSKAGEDEATLPLSSPPRFPFAPPLRRTSRSWTMPRQSGTEFRRNSRVQPMNVADARKRFEEVDGKKAAKESGGGVSRSQSFTPASAASSAATIKASLLAWCQQKTRGYRGVDIRNFSSSWADGLAFAAIAHHYAPDAFDFDSLDPTDRRTTMEIAFRVADDTLGAMPLLEVDDMLVMKDRPDWKCVFTYVQSLYRHGRDFEAKKAQREE